MLIMGNIEASALLIYDPNNYFQHFRLPFIRASRPWWPAMFREMDWARLRNSSESYDTPHLLAKIA